MSAVPTLQATGQLVYFGKVPCRGDFVRSTQHGALIEQLDHWQSHTMERLSSDPRWKLLYDAASPLAFAVLGTGSRVGLAGHWMASQDASGRRFPFLTACALSLNLPRDTLPVAPVALARIWGRLEQVARVAHAATDLAHAQGSLDAPMDVDLQAPRAQQAQADFLASRTVAALDQMLSSGTHRFSVRHATLALGLLLQPAMAQGPARLNKVLCCPLPQEPAVRASVAGWWLSLVLGFFSRHEVELGLFLASVDGRPHLVLGFHGASPAVLHALIDPARLDEHGVFLRDLDWVEDEVDADYGMRKLSNYLRDPGLSLAQALSVYNEVFLGV